MTHSVQILIYFSHHLLLNGDTYLTFLCAHFSPLKAITYPSISCTNSSSLTRPISLSQHPSTLCSFLLHAQG